MAKDINTDTLKQQNIFTIDYKDIEGRLDPLFYSLVVLGFLNKTKFQLMTIGHISEYVKSGFAVGKEAQADEDEQEKYIQIRPTNMTDNGELKFDKNIYVSVNYVTDKPDQILEKNSVLFNNTNSQELVGKTCFFNLDGIYFSSNHVTRIKTKNTLVLPEYLCWILNYYQRHKVFFNICTNWNNQSGVNGELLKTIKIPVPPIEIQRKIVTKIQNSQTNRQKNKSRSNSYLSSIDSYILEKLGITLPEEDNSLDNRIFTVEYKDVLYKKLKPEYHKPFYKQIENIFDNSKYDFSNLSKNIDYIESGSRPQGGVGDISEGILSFGGEHVNDLCEIEIKTPKYIPLEFHKKILNTETKLNDIILVKDGATTGKIGILTDLQHVGQNINEHVFIIRTSKLNAFYLCYLLHSNLYQILINREITGATVTGLTKDAIKNIKIIVPPLAVQNEIAEHIKALRKQSKEAEQQAVAEMEKTKAEIENEIFENN